jgi:hypothetical protein
MEAQVDNQVAAPPATRTPNWHRANQNRSSRVRMEGWRQGKLGRRDQPCPTKKHKNPLDSDRPSHGRPFHSFAPCLPPERGFKCKGDISRIDTWAIHEGHHFGHTVRVDLYRMSDLVDGIASLLRSDFVEAIQHFAARPQHCSTQREDQESGHFLISSWQPEQAMRLLLRRP